MSRIAELAIAIAEGLGVYLRPDTPARIEAALREAVREERKALRDLLARKAWIINGPVLIQELRAELDARDAETGEGANG